MNCVYNIVIVSELSILIPCNLTAYLPSWARFRRKHYLQTDLPLNAGLHLSSLTVRQSLY